MRDNSAAGTYSARVLGKRTAYSSKSRSYYIKVAPWGPKTGENEISIRKSGFDRIKVDDEIKISLKDGSLGIPWFIIQIKKI